MQHPSPQDDRTRTTLVPRRVSRRDAATSQKGMSGRRRVGRGIGGAVRFNAVPAPARRRQGDFKESQKGITIVRANLRPSGEFGHVFLIMSFETFESAIVSPALKAVARHWNAARGAQRMPGWGNIKPAAIVPHLPIVWAFKYDPETVIFTRRLVGDGIASLLGGKGIRGGDMAEGYPADQYPAVFARNKRVVTEPSLMHGRGAMFRHLDRYGTGERIMLPLAEDGEHGDGIFGATEYRMSAMLPSEEISAAGEVVDWYALD